MIKNILRFHHSALDLAELRRSAPPCLQYKLLGSGEQSIMLTVTDGEVLQPLVDVFTGVDVVPGRAQFSLWSVHLAREGPQGRDQTGFCLVLGDSNCYFTQGTTIRSRCPIAAVFAELTQMTHNSDGEMYVSIRILLRIPETCESPEDWRISFVSHTETDCAPLIAYRLLNAFSLEATHRDEYPHEKLTSLSLPSLSHESSKVEVSPKSNSLPRSAFAGSAISRAAEQEETATRAVIESQMQMECANYNSNFSITVIPIVCEEAACRVQHSDAEVGQFALLLNDFTSVLTTLAKVQRAQQLQQQFSFERRLVEVAFATDTKTLQLEEQIGRQDVQLAHSDWVVKVVTASVICTAFLFVTKDECVHRLAVVSREMQERGELLQASTSSFVAVVSCASRVFSPRTLPTNLSSDSPVHAKQTLTPRSGRVALFKRPL